MVRNRVIFAGKVVNPDTGEWPNNRLVLAFLNGREAGRAISSLSVFPTPFQILTGGAKESSSSDGLNDGIFQIAVNNDYGLTLANLQEEKGLPVSFFSGMSTDNSLFNHTVDPNIDYTFLGTWLGETYENAVLRVPIKQKNIEYAIKVVEGDSSTLPQALLAPGNTSLEEDGSIVVSLEDDPTGVSNLGSSDNIDIRSVDYEISVENIEVNKVTVPINNCGGSTRVSQTYSQSQTYIREYQLDAEASVGLEIPLPLWLRLIPELSLRYGFQQGQVDTKTVEYEMAAEAGTSLVYTISWQEVWESGQAEAGSGDDLIIVPFRVRSDMIYALDSESIPCN